MSLIGAAVKIICFRRILKKMLVTFEIIKWLLAFITNI
jgi:hypothetical protein